jgi:predicted metal-dependent phosphoesterase TrpH
MRMARAFIDLHCHTRASFDCLSNPADVARLAAERGLTHLAITDHDRIDGALEARAAAPAGLTVIVGEEVKTSEGDLICLYLEHAIPPGLTAAETIAAARRQGALVGIPHPFDTFRGSLARSGRLDDIAPLVDWIEGHNARLVGDGNERAVTLAAEHDKPVVAVSDAHSLIEVGVAYTALDGDPSTPAGLLAALAGAELVPGRASYLVRLLTPASKVIQRVRGNRRVQATETTHRPPGEGT